MYTKFMAKKSGDYGDAKKNNEKDDDLLTTVIQDFQKSRKYVENNYKSLWEDCWRVYNGKRVKVGYQGISDTTVPETFTIIESLVANIGGGKPKFTFMPTNEDQNEDTEIINELIDFYWDQNHMSAKTLNWIRESLIYGNSILFAYWDNDMPCVKNIPLIDFFIDPNATSLDNAKYMGYRYLANKKDLEKAKVTDPVTGDMVDKYKNLSDVTYGNKSWEKLDKEEKEQFLGSTLGKDAHKEQCEVIFWVSREKVIEVANRGTVIRSVDTPYQRKKTSKLSEIKPFFPFAALRDYVDTSLFYAKGEVEVIKDQQETVNDIANQKLDNITYIMNNMWTIDPQFADMVPEIESLPGAVYPLPFNALRPIDKPVVTQHSDAEMLRLKEEMRRATAADEIIQGASQDQGRITATEIQAQVNQANQRFNTKLSMLEDEGYAQLGSILFKLIQIFVTEKQAVRIVGPEGVQWKDYDPKEFTGEYEPKVRLEATSKAMKAEEGQKYQQLYQLLLDDPSINQTEVKKLLFEKVFNLKQDQIQKLLDVPEPPEPELPPELMGGEMGMMPPELMPPEMPMELPSEIPSEALAMQGMF